MADEYDALFLAFQEAVAGRYSLQRELGRGGMGVVYLAREVRLDRSVAIKLLPPELAAHTPLRDRFIREARTAARLSHPYIVPIHSVDEIGGFVFYVMAYVDGETLAQRVTARGPLPPAQATRVLREVAWALAYAHAQGIIHRDIKPANILLERGTERAMVADFGIARLAQAGGETGVGELLGTPEYMSPEQATGEAVDARSDLYSLGIVGYYAVTGSLPFTAPTAQAVLAQQVTQPAPPVASVARAVPRSLGRAIDTCLHKHPAARMQTGGELADALEQALDMRAEVPVPIRVFLDRRRIGTTVAVPAMLVPMALAFSAQIARLGATPGRLATLAMLGVGIVSLPPLILARSMRPLLKLGYGPNDIAAALRAAFQRRREEFLFEFGPGVTRRERLFRLGGVVALTSFASGVVAIVTGGSTREWLPPFTLMSAYFGVLAIFLSTRWRRLRSGAGSWWADRWQGKMGRLLDRLASINLGARSVAADRPTEMAIAFSAEALFQELPKEVRRSLGELPEVLHGLEKHARVLRARIDELDAAIQQAHSGPARAGTRIQQDNLVAELRETRQAVEKKLADIVTGLETLRLDLLRLRAGRGSAESITQNLEAGKLLGEEVDRLVAGQAEVERVVRGFERSPV